MRTGTSFITLLGIVLMGLPVKAERVLSISYLSANYQSCTGHCEKNNINCDQKSMSHGSVSWCEKNCLNRNKSDEYQFRQAINFCRTKKEDS